MDDISGKEEGRERRKLGSRFNYTIGNKEMRDLPRPSGLSCYTYCRLHDGNRKCVFIV